MAIIDDLNAIDTDNNLSENGKRLAKYAVRGNAIRTSLASFFGSTLSFNSGGNSYSVRIDNVVVQPDGWLTFYGEIKKNNVVVPLSWPLMFRNNPFTDENGNENPLQAAKNMIADVAG